MWLAIVLSHYACLDMNHCPSIHNAAMNIGFQFQACGSDRFDARARHPPTGCCICACANIYRFTPPGTAAIHVKPCDMHITVEPQKPARKSSFLKGSPTHGAHHGTPVTTHGAPAEVEEFQLGGRGHQQLIPLQKAILVDVQQPQPKCTATMDSTSQNPKERNGQRKGKEKAGKGETM